MSSKHLSPHKIITMLLTVFPMLSIASLWLIHFITGSLYHLSSILPILLPLRQTQACFLYWFKIWRSSKASGIIQSKSELLNQESQSCKYYSKGQKRWVSTPADKQNINSFFSAFVLFCLSIDWIITTHNREGNLLSPPVQMLISLRSIFTDIFRKHL